MDPVYRHSTPSACHIQNPLLVCIGLTNFGLTNLTNYDDKTNRKLVGNRGNYRKN